MATLAAMSLVGAGVVAIPEGEEPKPVYGPQTPEPTTPKPTTPTTPSKAERGAHKRAEVAKRYTVRAGDTLSGIAEAKLGDADKWPNLWGANREAVGSDPSLLHPGTVLELRTAKAPRLKPAEGNGPRHAKPEPAAPVYADNLDGWIREALAVMAEHGIPGTYSGIRRNIMRESGGNRYAVNDWDVNAQNGTPSKGLLQTIEPTFRAYHVPGTSWDVFDPVANITAACNYAAQRYGSIDNVYGAY
ncbi:transglycosylase SLT domain-containing protein [Streptomyces sp. NPDC101221]|uniref:transglycosylase SLT domain-containing protein n=1 Tax=Streptomyces sp. NPDC101221 TaxID=3366132 RepID=UPI00382F8023